MHDNKLVRLLRHRLWDEADARRALPPPARLRLQQQVAASEARHSGEIRICVEAGLPTSYLWRGAPVRQRALALFGKLRVWDTEHNNGVLIYLLLAERSIELVADRGLSRLTPPDSWPRLVAELGGALQQGRFEQGLAAAIDAVSALLLEHFPLPAGQAPLNELPDAVILL
ncbi:MAG: TPM domain-containing protein [Burkholderiaceae bacterium]